MILVVIEAHILLACREQMYDALITDLIEESL